MKYRVVKQISWGKFVAKPGDVLTGEEIAKAAMDVWLGQGAISIEPDEPPIPAPMQTVAPTNPPKPETFNLNPHSDVA